MPKERVRRIRKHPEAETEVMLRAEIARLTEALQATEARLLVVDRMLADSLQTTTRSHKHNLESIRVSSYRDPCTMSTVLTVSLGNYSAGGSITDELRYGTSMEAIVGYVVDTLNRLLNDVLQHHMANAVRPTWRPSNSMFSFDIGRQADRTAFATGGTVRNALENASVAEQFSIMEAMSRTGGRRGAITESELREILEDARLAAADRTRNHTSDDTEGGTD